MTTTTTITKPIIFIIVLALTVVADSDILGLKGKPFKWSYCDTSTKYPLQISTLKISPDPPKRGSKVTLEVSGTLSGEIAKGAKLSYTVKLGLITLSKKTNLDLCNVLAGIKDKQVPKCPVAAGQFEIRRMEEFPGEAPGGKYTVEAEAVGADGNVIVCLKGDMSLPLLGE